MHLATSVFCLALCSLCSSYCIKEPPRTYHLIKRCQRSNQSIVELENVATLGDCFELAERSRALALNYSPLRGIGVNLFETKQRESKTGLNFPRRSNRRHFLYQPEEFFNCHVLQCPESSAFKTMVFDSRFDYYSLYGNPPDPTNFTCVPGLGMFQLNLTPERYSVASQRCKKATKGTLAHVVSEARTNALSMLLQGPDFMNGSLKLAYVGLNYSSLHNKQFKTSENEDLNCFLYRAWAPGHPKTGKNFLNQSCVALTSDFSWMTVECDRKLPYFCEIYTSPLNYSFYANSCEMFLD